MAQKIQTISKYFVNGNLLDIVIKGTTFDEYRKVYDFLVKSDYELFYYKDLDDAALPHEFVEITNEPDASHNIQIDFGFGSFSWLLYEETVMTFEVDSDEIESAEDYAVIDAFIDTLIAVTQKNVAVFLEEGEQPIYSVMAH